MESSIIVLVTDMLAFSKAILEAPILDVEKIYLSDGGFIFVKVNGDGQSLFRLGKWLVIYEDKLRRV